MIKAIFFDLDGVLTTDAKGSLTMSQNLCNAMPNLTIDEVLSCYRQDIEPLNMGQIPLSDVWKRMCSTLKIPASDNLLKEMLRKVPKNDVMFDLARSLSKNYVLGIITDNCSERMDILNDELKLDELFDPIVVSAIEHASKCDGTTRIFDVALTRAGCKADETIFIDNQEKNLVTPMKMGMKTHLHDDLKNDVVTLRATLFGMGVHIADESLPH